MFQDNLKALRKKKGITQEELAARLNVVRQTVSKWEKGLSVPDSELLIKLAEILEVPVSRLLGSKIEAEEQPDALATAFPNQRAACDQKQAGKKSLESNSLHRRRHYCRICSDLNSCNRLYLFAQPLRHNRQLAVY